MYFFEKKSILPCMACRIFAPLHDQNDGEWRLYLKRKGWHKTKRKHLTNILDIVEHVQTKHNEQDDYGEKVPFHFLGKDHLVDSWLDLVYHPSTWICDPGGEEAATTKVGEDAVVDLVRVLVQLLLCLFAGSSSYKLYSYLWCSHKFYFSAP